LPDSEPPRDAFESWHLERGRLRRSAPIARLLLDSAVTALRSRQGEQPSRELHARTADRYAVTLGQSKGVLMKLGQMLSFAAVRSAVPHDLQATYAAALARLRTDAPPMPAASARTVLERELGKRTDAVFSSFDWQPFAAASIGQVHAARLLDGREVAVKIQYPGVAEAVKADLKNVELLASLLALAIGGLFPRGRKLDLRSAAQELGARIEEELDYRIEASNQAEFVAHFDGHPFIRVPNLIEDLCTTRVLTQDLVRGSSWEEALTSEQYLRDQWAEAIHRFVFGTYYRLHLFNADPHPGNFIFHDDGAVTFLDYGSVKRLRADQVEMLVGIYRACLRDDVLGTWMASVEAGMWRSTDPVTPEEAFAYFHEDNALFWAPERFAATPDYVARSIERRFSPAGPSSNALRYCTMPPEYTYMVRIEIAVASVIGHLRAANDWGSFAAEYCEDADPVTEMGRREQAFFARRRTTGADA
jgi:predicted unusual protein kinase regulating ubiquinone biosynthesis (AarF/ABC1/UbiB family)